MSGEPRRTRCLIVEDEPLSRDLLRSFVEEDDRLELLGCASDAVEALQTIPRHRPELLFLDVRMPEMDGFELLERLPAEHFPIVIFVTAHDSYALRAFDARAVDYLLKPFDRLRFERAVAQALQRIETDRKARYAETLERMMADRRMNRIVVRSAGRLLLLRAADVDWVEARGNYVRIHTGTGQHEMRATLREFMSRLPSSFVRIHRSAVVNVARIAEVQPWYTGEYVIVLANGRELTLSRTYRDAFFHALGQTA